VIAAEITTRLLPGYLRQLAEVNEYNEREHQDARTRAAIIETIAAMFPGSHVRGTGHRGRYTEALLQGGGSVETYGDGSSLKIELHSIPPGAAMAMLAVLADARRHSQ
jgi:hypothetical protein